MFYFNLTSIFPIHLKNRDHKSQRLYTRNFPQPYINRTQAPRLETFSPYNSSSSFHQQSLLLLNYLVRNGSERVVTSSREHIYDLRSLENYSYIDEFGKDQGINIRHKVRELIDFIQDDDKLREERKKAKKNKDKYIGMSSEAMGGRGGMMAAIGSGPGGMGPERWMDNPKWQGSRGTSGGDGHSEWDRENRPKGFEDANNRWVVFAFDFVVWRGKRKVYKLFVDQNSISNWHFCCII